MFFVSSLDIWSVQLLNRGTSPACFQCVGVGHSVATHWSSVSAAKELFSVFLVARCIMWTTASLWKPLELICWSSTRTSCLCRSRQQMLNLQVRVRSINCFSAYDIFHPHQLCNNKTTTGSWNLQLKCYLPPLFLYLPGLEAFSSHPQVLSSLDKLAVGKILLMETLEPCPQNDTPAVVLYDTTQDDDININSTCLKALQDKTMNNPLTVRMVPPAAFIV